MHFSFTSNTQLKITQSLCQYLLYLDSLRKSLSDNGQQLLWPFHHEHFVTVDQLHLQPELSDTQGVPKMLLCARLYNLKH